MTAYICIAPEKVLSNSIRYGRDEVDWEAIHRLLLLGLNSYISENIELYLSDTYLKLPNLYFSTIKRKTAFNKDSISTYTLTLMETLLAGIYNTNNLYIIEKLEKYEYPYVMDLNLRTVKLLFYEAFFKLGVNTMSDATLIINNQPQNYTPPEGSGVSDLINSFVNSTETRLAYLILTL